jgi:uncharacterized protein (TIGR03435 family)
VAKLPSTIKAVTLAAITSGTLIHGSLVHAPLLHAQTASPIGGAAMAFDVASVKSDRSNDPASSRFPLGPGDAYAPGGVFSARNQPLIVYLRFAYKLGQSDLLGLPAWVYDDRFDIEARTPGNPTKDQMRLMMQSLLAERFKLGRHTERRTQAVFQLVLSKVGTTGPQLQRHSDDGSCAGAPPISCGSIGPVPASLPGRGRIVGHAVTMERIAGFLKNPFTGVDRPVVDGTRLTGTFDMSVEWSLAPDSAQPPGATLEDSGPTFLEALHEQLGLNLKSTKGPVDVLVIDHVEHPSED